MSLAIAWSHDLAIRAAGGPMRVALLRTGALA